MGCKTSKFSEDDDHFHGLRSRPDTPSIYSSHTRTPPLHSRNNSLDQGLGRPPMLQSKFSDSFHVTKPNTSSSKFFKGAGTANSSSDPEKNRSFCNHQRQGNSPCFACLREKPKPRRHRSRRNAQVMIPRASYYGKKKRHSRSSSIEAPLRPEEQPPWVTARHGVFVPVTVANELNVSITQHEREEGRNFQSFRPSSDESGRTVVGGYIVSPEAYYSSLPLPDLPPDTRNQTAGHYGYGRGRLPAWI